uniref:Interleukin 13 receptor subunit alpha 1 n=1 Tax=Anser brachyrhynchus TaxID=132585 RepID=A0A8B9C3Y1_9AVES
AAVPAAPCGGLPLPSGCGAGAGGRAGAKVLPPPSNLNYSFVQICTLNWTWNPPENISSSCDLEYSSDIVIDEVPQDQRVSSSHLEAVLCSSEYIIVLKLCHDNASEPSRWVETSVLPKGIPGTAAVGLNCVWHNLEYMVCKWHPGENASSDTNYTLFYWFVLSSCCQPCYFECTFGLTFPRFTNTYPAISILIRDDSEEIRPVCASKNPTTLVKPATPKIVEVSYVNGGIYLQWSESDTFPANCLYYELRYHNGDLTVAQTIRVSFHYLQLTFFFPVKPPKTSLNFNNFCLSGVNPDSTFYFVLIVTIPLIVAVSTIVLLVYLKRLKILILPPIPDPREILKRMFGEQNDNPQVKGKTDEVLGQEEGLNAKDGLIRIEMFG